MYNFNRLFFIYYIKQCKGGYIMANAILLNQSTNLTKDNILDTLNKSVISDIMFENNKLIIKYVNDNAEDKEIILPLDTIQTDIRNLTNNKINKVTRAEGQIPQLNSAGQLSATGLFASRIVAVGDDTDLNYEPIKN